jgi:hypothetical protein
MKLTFSFGFFKVKARGAGPVWIEEVDIDLKFLKRSPPKQGLKSLFICFSTRVLGFILCMHCMFMCVFDVYTIRT